MRIVVLRVARWLALVGSVVGAVSLSVQPFMMGPDMFSEGNISRLFGVSVLGAFLSMFSGLIVWSLLTLVADMVERLEWMSGDVYDLKHKQPSEKHRVSVEA